MQLFRGNSSDTLQINLDGHDVICANNVQNRAAITFLTAFSNSVAEKAKRNGLNLSTKPSIVFFPVEVIMKQRSGLSSFANNINLSAYPSLVLINNMVVQSEGNHRSNARISPLQTFLANISGMIIENGGLIDENNSGSFERVRGNKPPYSYALRTMLAEFYDVQNKAS